MLSNLLTTETRCLSRTQFAFHTLLLTGIAVVVGVFYVSWFGNAGFRPSVWSAYGREVVGVAMQYYVLVWLIQTYSARPVFLITGLLAYYWLTYTYYFLTAVWVYQYMGVDDFSGAAYHFIKNKDHYWRTLFSYETLMRLVRFPLLITIFPLLLRAGMEVYRRQIRNAQLQQQNTQLELNYLRSQVNPHFLFNILNNIYALTEEESPRAARLVAQLSGLMRYALYETAGLFVPLHKELQFIRAYVDLEQTRTSKRLTLTMALPETVDETLQIAPFILITFVENAFKHGVETTTRKSWVNLSVQVEGNTLRMHVANSKPANGAPAARGVGLQNVQKRLVLLYSHHHTLTIDHQPNSYAATLTVRLD